MTAKLFTPFTIKETTFKNRVVMSPMCMNSSLNKDGKASSWHMLHYGTRAAGQVGLIIVEATAVSSEGRITDEDLGLWSDEHMDGLKKVVDMVHENGSKIGIQIGHAGRKAELEEEIVAPSSIAVEGGKAPKEMTQVDISEMVNKFKEATRRAKEVGFDVIELHAAHGYLINQFLSPITNQRTDQYGGNEDNRYRFLEEIIEAVKEVWEGPLFARISADEYHELGNSVETYVRYSLKMKEQGVDLIDCSSGGVVNVPIDVFPGYQVKLADKIRTDANIATGAVGLIKTGIQAEEILKNERADMVFIGRELIRDPYWARTAAIELYTTIDYPAPYRNYGATWFPTK